MPDACREGCTSTASTAYGPSKDSRFDGWLYPAVLDAQDRFTGEGGRERRLAGA
ncbi:hypothetical protein GCM10027612_35530 [Microbispora bryophytorum subsp. camponoti]